MKASGIKPSEPPTLAELDGLFMRVLGMTEGNRREVLRAVIERAAAGLRTSEPPPTLEELREILRQHAEKAMDQALNDGLRAVIERAGGRISPQDLNVTLKEEI